MNNIEKIRAEINKDFNEATFTKADYETFISPSGKFRLDTTNYWCKEPNRELTKIEIYEQINNEKLFDFFSDEGQFFFAWLEANNIEYLICAENLCGGQTIIDLTNRRMSGYSSGDDGFILTDFHLSPDGKTLATIGCYWGCQYSIKLFDFTNPMTLPLPELRNIELLDNDEIIIGWIDNENFKTKGVKREREPEYFEGGGMRFKTISETPMERLLNINGAEKMYEIIK